MNSKSQDFIFPYKWIVGFNESLANFSAKESTDIPVEVYDVIRLELGDRGGDRGNKAYEHREIRKILKKHNFTKYYEYIPYIWNEYIIWCVGVHNIASWISSLFSII